MVDIYIYLYLYLYIFSIYIYIYLYLYLSLSLSVHNGFFGPTCNLGVHPAIDTFQGGWLGDDTRKIKIPGKTT